MNLGGVERTRERRYFLAVVPDRTAGTLIRIINQYVKGESIMH